MKQERSLRAKEILGAKVINRAGEPLGTLEDIVFAAATGRVAYALLSIEAGEEAHVTPVPWGRFVWEAEGQVLVAEMTAHHLARAPHFRAREWDREEWQDQVEGYFETVEEEETGVAEFDTGAEGTRRAESPTGRGIPPSQPARTEEPEKPS